ncbi:carboxypeptidase-like regulatory domain-containing protein [Puia sp. P3]|uniref:carboxypeptidase-like regulatory domain-containing protein n=1 Tax=Puia sp. P3 TaxID=3423952 RepID=UPI003D66481E
MRKLLASVLGVCLALCQLRAQNRSISGTVTDEKGNPLAAVTITALTSDRKVTSTTVTDISGVFRLNVSEKPGSSSSPISDWKNNSSHSAQDPPSASPSNPPAGTCPK